MCVCYTASRGGPSTVADPNLTLGFAGFNSP